MPQKKNLFETAKKKTAKAKKDNHIVVELPKLEELMQKMAAINLKLAEMEADYAILDSKVREESKEAMINLYNKTKKFPGTLKIKAGTMILQFITSDRYKSIDEERAEELIETYGEEIVTDETKYSFPVSFPSLISLIQPDVNSSSKLPLPDKLVCELMGVQE